MGGSSSKKAKKEEKEEKEGEKEKLEKIDEIIQMNQLNNNPIKVHNPPEYPQPQNKVIEKKKVNEVEDEIKQFEKLVFETNNNINKNINIITDYKNDLMKINRDINSEFNFLNLIKDDFDNSKACIVCCNLNENDQKILSKLEWGEDKINQEEQNKRELIELIKRNRSEILKLIENN